jgi:RHS repeat-associated protein
VRRVINERRSLARIAVAGIAALFVLFRAPIAAAAATLGDDDDLIVLGIPKVTLSLTNPPANNIYTAPASIAMTATTKVAAGSISRVDYFQGISLIGTATTTPYGFTWGNVAAGQYALTARATSSLGFRKTSVPVNIRVCDVPMVSLTAPTSGALLPLNANVTLQATAASPANACSITKVEFYAQSGGSPVLVGTALGNPPYQASWTPTASAIYALTAKVYDERNVTATSSAVNVTVEPPPAISITSPASGAVFAAPASIPFTVNATDNVSVAKVEYYNGVTLIGTSTTAPFGFTWSNVAKNDYSVTAKAYDNQGLTTTSTTVIVIVTTPPTVSITAPATNAVVASGSNLTISATASDPDGSVAKVEFYRGTTLLCTITATPYTCTWSNVDPGIYSLTAKAYDNQGATTTSSPITLTAELAPAVNITTPVNNAPFTAPASIPITATATDSDGVTKVEFYQGTMLLGTVNTGASGNTGSNYTFTWANVGAGAYAVTAKAYDSFGVTATSAVVNVTVTGTVSVPTPMALKSFAPASVATGGSSVLTITLNPKLLYVVNSNDANVSVFDTTSNTLRSTFNLGSGISPYAAAVTATGSRLYVTTVSYSGVYAVAVVATASNAVLATIGVGAGPIGVAVNPAGSRVYTANDNANTVSVIDTASNSVIATVPVPADPINLAVNPAGTRLYVTSYASASVSVLDTSTNVVIATIPVGGYPRTIAISPDGSRVYVPNSGGNTVSVIDAGSNTVLTTIPVGSDPYGIALNAAGTRAYVANWLGNTVSIIDTSTNTVVATVPVGSHPFGVALNPSGTRVYVANTDSNNLSVIDAATNTVAGIIATGHYPSIQPSSIVPPFSGATTGVAFTDTYPAGLVNTASASLATTCGGTVTAANGGSSVALSGGTIPYNDGCTVTVNVTSSTAGTYVNNTGAISSGNAGTGASASASLVVTTVPNAPPSVSLTLPADGATFTAPAAITLTASASDTDGSVSKVEFYKDQGQGPQLIGTVNSTDSGHSGTNWTYNWANVPAGTYTLTAKATDNLGATATAPVAPAHVTITVQSSTNNAPVITSVTPASLQIVLNGTANYTVLASDPDPGDTITVKLYRGSTLLATGIKSTTAPNTYTIAYTPTAAVTNDQLTVIVTDNRTPPASAQQFVTLTVIAPPSSATPNADAVIPPSYATPAVGTIAGSFGVSDSGAAGYAIPIQVPPGTNGMQPSLALTYNSQGGNGLLGVGWSLTGLSVITRCPKTIAQDSMRVGINYDGDATNDNYCLDGQRLVKVSGPFSVADYNYSSTSPVTATAYEYRTEVDTYAKIEGYEDAQALAVAGPYRFRVWTKAGQVFDYGSRWWILSRGWDQRAGQNGSQQPRGNVGKVWVLDRVVDPSGNFMEIDYIDRVADGRSVLHLPSNCGQQPAALAATKQPIGAYPNVEYWPTVIRYYAKGAVQSECSSAYPSNQVRFSYEDVPSQASTATRDRYYDAGAGQTSLSKRLTGIDTSVDGYWSYDPLSDNPGTHVKSYRLSYRNPSGGDVPSQQTGRSLLQTVQECGADGVCLPATQFEWAEKYWNATGHSFAGPSVVLPIFFSAGAAYVADWNGDGISDLIGWSNEDAPDGSSVRKLIVCLGTTTPAPGFNCGIQPLLSLGAGQPSISPEFMDMNGDGRADLVYRITGGQWVVCLSDGNTGCTAAGGMWPISSFTAPSWRGDMDGDGKIDIITYLGNGVFQTCLTNNPGTGGSTCYTQNLSPTVQGTYAAYPYTPCNVPTEPSNCESFSDPNVQYQVLVADVNGDGKADLIRRRTDSDSESQWKVCFSDFGAGRTNTYQCHDRWVQSSTGRVNQTTTYDFNGDGIADMASTQGQQQSGITITWTVCLSTGDGAFEFQDANIHWDPTQQLYVDGNNSPIDYYNSTLWPRCRPWTGTGLSNDTKVIYGDFNGDGRTDLASWDASTNSWRVCLSTGSDFSCSNWQGPILQGSNPDLNAQVLTGDFNGDGKTDIVLLRADGTTQLTLSTGPQTGDVLTKITTGLGATTQVTYAPLTDTSVYAKGTGASASNLELDIQSPMYVVKQTQASDGIGGLFTSSYFYEGLRGRTDGRGLYGFAKKRMRDDSGIVTEIEYQRIAAASYPANWPVVGRPQYVRKYAPTWPTPSPPPPGTQTYPVYLADISTSPNDAASVNLPGTCAWLSPTSCTGTLVRVNKTTNGWLVRNSKTCGASGFAPCGGAPLVVEGLLTATTDQSWELDGTALPLTTTTFTLDEYGNPLHVTAASDDGYSKDTVNTYVIDIRYTIAADLTDTTHWLLGRLASATVTSTKPGEASPTARNSNFAYNGIAGVGCAGAALGQLCYETIQPTDGSTLWQQTSYQYDQFGNRTIATVKFRQTDGTVTSRQTTTTFGYNGRFPTQVKNDLGQKETRQFDVRFGVMTQLTGPNGIVTKSLYDGFGRKYGERILDAVGNRMSEVYTTIDTSGLSTNEKYRVATLMSGAGVPQQPTSFNTQAFYDQLQRGVRGLTKAFAQTDGISGYAQTQTAYDNLGRKASMVKPAGGGTVTTAMLYDVLGRPGTELMTGAGLSLTTTYTYSTFTNLSIDGQAAIGGHKTKVTQTGSGINPRDTTKYVNSQSQTIRVTDGAGGNTDFRFDAYGNLIKTIGPTGIAEVMTYDLRGRKKSLSNPDSGFWSYTYNGAGELVKQTDAKGQDTVMFYDSLGRMIERREHPGSSQTTTPFVTVSSYDAYANGAPCSYGIGKLCEMWTATMPRSTVGGNNLTPETRTQTTYDQGGRATRGTTQIDGQTFLSITTFDANSRVDKLVYPSGFIVVHSYTTWGGQLFQVAEWANGVTGTVHWQANSRYADGQINAMQIGSNSSLTTTKTYDGFGRIATLHTGAGNAIQNATYTFDALGNLSNRVDSSAGQGQQNFSYDLLNRVTSDGVTTVSYYADGNILNKGGTYSYFPATHRLQSAAGYTYGYDNNGNVFQIAGGTNTRTLNYTAFNLPSSITAGPIQSPSGSTAYVYDGAHARMKEVSTGATSSGTTYYLGGFEQHLRGSDNVLEQRHYLRTSEGIVGIVTRRSNAVNDARYWHKDHLGSVAVITDAAGNVKEKFSYDAWGNRTVVVSAQSTGDPYNEERGYTGHEHLVEVGLTHMNGRIYDPATGRFLQADPVVQDPYNGQNYNRYGYVLNNPLSFTDPTGFSFWTKWRRTIFAIAAAATLQWYVSAAIIAEGAAMAGTLGEYAELAAAATPGANAVGAIAGGFAAGGIQGGNIESAVAGAIFGGLSFGIGQVTTGAAGASLFGEGAFAANVGLHAALGCAQQAAAGGSCKAGVMAGGFSTIAGPLIGGPAPVQFAARVIIGGISSRIGGGKFENGAITAAFAYLFNDLGHPDQRPWNGLGPPPAVLQAQEALAARLDELFKDFADRLSYIFKSDSVVLARNMAQESNEVREEGQHAHHIVAATDPRADPARQVLAKVDMSINSAFNGVFLDPQYHARIHTNVYYETVNTGLFGATSYTDVAARLTVMRALINAGKFPF